MKKIRKYLKKLDSFAAKHPYLVLGIILVLPGLILPIPLPFFETISSWLWDHIFVWIFFIIFLDAISGGTPLWRRRRK